ncbi:MAG: carboxylating nicotinate-nucleotide diphosphorylase [Gammaproteobacteria bacterium]|nr:carboxylating nicotinate-nucleotide diphosphorylase [Gammaproteobacteria bacterium]
MTTIPEDISHSVELALQEDIGSGDISAALIPAANTVNAVIQCRQQAVICGLPWIEEVYLQLDPTIKIEWLIEEGDAVETDTEIGIVMGTAREILTGERTALNFLQTLSATATQTRRLVELIADTPATLLDTRKTLPGLRAAQKYAVRVGGGKNHRIGLYDAFLIKENHIAACGGITPAITAARESHPDKTLEIEVRSIDELNEALLSDPDIIMLDNFTPDSIKEAVVASQGRCKLEASGGIDQELLVKIAKTGVDYISVGGLTKHCQAIDFSLLVQ